MAETADWTASAIGATDRQNKGWIKFLIGAGVIVAALTLLLYTSMQGNAQYYLTVKELHDRAGEMVGKDVRVSGLVVPNSISYNASTLHLEFDMLDKLGDGDEEPLRIVLDGEPLPDQMNDEAEAIAEGQLQADGTFRAESLMMKCASKYETSVEN